MFVRQRPSQSAIENFFFQQRSQGFSYPEVGLTNGTLPRGYNIDQNRERLGKGGQTFYEATASLRAWQMFKLGWVELFPPNVQIDVGATVAVLVHHFGFWSLNACRVVYVIEEDRRFGFAYGTLEDHAEQGEERFLVEWLPEDDSVRYNILAFSRPKKWQARVVRPMSRMLQRKFARDSIGAMMQAVHRGLPNKPLQPTAEKGG